MGLSSVERLGCGGSTSMSFGSQSTLSTSCHSMSTISCQCKADNQFVAPQQKSTGQKKLKFFKKIEQRMGLGPKTTVPYPIPTNLPPLAFHKVHGDNIRLSQKRGLAKRVENYCKGITFSARPVAVNERVYIKISDIYTNWQGGIRFGFTINDPTALHKKLPKHALPDLTIKMGFWIKELNESYCERDNILFYYVTPAGHVHFGINGEEKGVFISGIETRKPLWTIIDVYGKCKTIEFLDYRHQMSASFNNGNPYSSQASLVSSASVRPQPVAQCQNVRAQMSQVAGSQRSLISNASTISSGILRGSQQLDTDVDSIVPAFQNMHTNASLTSLAESATGLLPGIQHIPYTIFMVNLPPNVITNPMQQQSVPTPSVQQSTQLLFSPKKSQMPLSPVAKDSIPPPGYPTASECTICCENSIDSVLYTCGHMCMCYECAVKQWRGIGGGHCPLCRAVIQDVIRTYKS